MWLSIMIGTSMRRRPDDQLKDFDWMVQQLLTDLHGAEYKNMTAPLWPLMNRSRPQRHALPV
jgi:hypothetical protein